MSYLGAAASLVRDGTYRIPTSSWTAADSTAPLAHFPPGFSTAVAVPVAMGFSPVQAGRTVVIACAAIGAAMMFAIVASSAGLMAAAVAVLVVFATPAVLSEYLSVLSEPLYIAAVVATMIAMAMLRVRGGGAGLALLTGLGACAVVMTRYAGAAVVAVAVLWALTTRASRRRRVTDAILVAAPSVVAIGLWVVRSMREGGPRAIRTFSVYGGLWHTLAEGAATVRDALVPGSGGFVWRSVVAGVGAVSLGVLVWYGWRTLSHPPSGEDNQRPDVRTRALLAAIGWIVAGCSVFLIAARVVADPNIPADERILSPLIVLGELAVVLAAAAWWPMWGRAARVVAAVVLVAWVAGAASQSWDRVSYALDEGNDFAGTMWRESPTIAWVRSEGTGHALYSNWPVALYFHAGRASHSLPAVLDPLMLNRFHDRLERQRGLVVAFSTPSPDVVPPDSLAARLGLREQARFSDGVVWGVP